MKTLENLKSQFIAALCDAQSMQQSARLGAAAGLLLASAPSIAQGFITGFSNMNTLAQKGVALIIVIGMLGGLGMILGGLFSAYKKYDRGNDDVTWGKIGMQIIAGGMAMALGWVGTNVVETLGGSSSDIGNNSIGR